jgi:hypothetical protein
MHVNEARLVVLHSISAMLLELAEGEQETPLTEGERADFSESMDDAAELILDRLGFDVTNVTETTPPLITAQLSPR